jgi:hypothetical protein
MKIIIRVWMLLLFCIPFLHANAQEVVSSSGSSYTTANLKLDFTIGEVVIFTGSNSSTIVNQGFHQETKAYYVDQDADGFGNAGIFVWSIAQPSGYVVNNTDCDDNNFSVNLTGSEICGNSIDEDCSGADLVCPLSGILAAENFSNIGQFGTGVQSTQSVNLSYGSNSVESPGLGSDLWYKFIAQNNAVRIALTGSNIAEDDNDLGLYNNPTTTGVQLIPISTENDVHPASLGVSADGGNEILFYSNLVAGNTYYILVRNNNATPGICALTVSYLKGSQADIGPYTGYTGVYGNTCQNFKGAFRANGTNYTVKRWTDMTGTGTPVWTYVIPSNSTICQLGKILPPNMSGATITYPITVDVTYTLPDAYGNMNTINAYGNVVTGVGLNSEAGLIVRTTDACPVFKSPTTGSVATNRSICGVDRYEWQFTEANSAGAPIGLPNPTPIYGPAGASRVLSLSTVPGIAGAKFYNVKIRTKHVDGVSLSSWGNTSCVKTIGAVGMAVENNEFISIRGKNELQVKLFPNPNNGHTVNLYAEGIEGEMQLRITDAAGRLVFVNRYVVEGTLNTNIDFIQTLADGMYLVETIHHGESQTMRMLVN